MMRYMRVWTVAATLMLALTAPAKAVTVWFDKAHFFSDALSSHTDYSFSSIQFEFPCPNCYTLGGPQTLGGAVFSSEGNSYLIDQLFFAGYGGTFFSGQTAVAGKGSQVKVDLIGLATPVYAISFDFGSYASIGPVPYSVSINGQFVEGGSLQGQYPYAGWRGYVSTTPIQTVEFREEDGAVRNSFDILGFSVGVPVVAQVPEPSTAIMLLVGMGLLIASARRRQAAGHRHWR